MPSRASILSSFSHIFMLISFLGSFDRQAPGAALLPPPVRIFNPNRCFAPAVNRLERVPVNASALCCQWDDFGREKHRNGAHLGCPVQGLFGCGIESVLPGLPDAFKSLWRPRPILSKITIRTPFCAVCSPMSSSVIRPPRARVRT